MTTTNASDVMRRALLRIDDTLILGALDHLNIKATAKVSAVVGMPLRSLQQKRDVASFAASAPVAAVRAMLELLAIEPLEKVVDLLGDHAESPTFDQLCEAVDRAVQGGMSEVTSSPSLLVPKEVDDEVREQRRRRREEEKRKKNQASSRTVRPTKAKRPEKVSPTPATVLTEVPAVTEIVRRRFIFTPAELEAFDPAHPLVGSVVLADVPFDAVDPLIPEQRSKIRPVLVVAASAESVLVLGIYSNPSPSRVLFQPWRRLGLAHVSFVATDRVRVPLVPEQAEKVGRLSDEEWNTLF